MYWKKNSEPSVNLAEPVHGFELRYKDSASLAFCQENSGLIVPLSEQLFGTVSHT